MSDNVNYPPHYTRGGIETIDFIEAKELSWCLGNVVKYVSRAGHKGDKLEDLEKAAFYLSREIRQIKGDAENDKSEAIRQRDKQIVELTQQINDANRAAATWNPIASRIQDERDNAIAERDEARRQIAELTWQCEAERKQSHEWNDIACKLQDELNEARKQVEELTRQRNIGVSRPPDGWFDAACQMADQRDEARKQVVELTKQLVAAGLLQPTETEQCHG